MYFLAEKMVTQDVSAQRRASRALLRDATPSRRQSVSQEPAAGQSAGGTPLTEGTAERPNELNSAILRHSLTAAENASLLGTPTSQVVRQLGGAPPTTTAGGDVGDATAATPPLKKRHSATHTGSVSARAGSVGNIGALVGANRRIGRRLLLNVVRAFLVRALFVVHSLTTIWAAVNVRNDASLWTFALVSALIAIEGAYTIVMRAGDERKWFSPSVLLYICATAPPLHLLETQICEWRKAQSIDRLDEKIHFQLLEQLLLVLLILGRWLLPKGEISREQLSQILLAYLAISSDIVEFFDVFKERVVYEKPFLQRIVLVAWTLSLLQFPFVLTVSRARKMRVAITEDAEEPKHSRFSQIIYDIDLWAIFLANGLQDMPFFVVRLYLVAYHGLVTYTMIFFICKNALIIVLQTYRAFIIINDRYARSNSSPVADYHHHHHHYHQHVGHSHHHHYSHQSPKLQHSVVAPSPAQSTRGRRTTVCAAVAAVKSADIDRVESIRDPRVGAGSLASATEDESARQHRKSLPHGKKSAKQRLIVEQHKKRAAKMKLEQQAEALRNHVLKFQSNST